MHSHGLGVCQAVGSIKILVLLMSSAFAFVTCVESVGNVPHNDSVCWLGCVYLSYMENLLVLLSGQGTSSPLYNCQHQ